MQRSAGPNSAFFTGGQPGKRCLPQVLPRFPLVLPDRNAYRSFVGGGLRSVGGLRQRTERARASPDSFGTMIMPRARSAAPTFLLHEDAP